MTWKLADFGLTVEGSSNTEHTTRYGTGSSGYRAPELMSDSGKRYTNKVDIWAMGCILFELATGNRAFNDDWAVFRYQSSRKFEGITLFDTVDPLPVTNHIVNMLKIKPSARPSAPALSQDFIQEFRTAQAFENPDLLRAHIVKVTLCSTIKTKSMEKVRMLLDAGADVNEKDEDGKPAVALAMTYDCTDMALLLLERGADANAHFPGSHVSLLQLASYSGNKRLVRLLLDSGADVNARGGYYGSALQVAVCGFPIKITKETSSSLFVNRAGRNIGGDYYGGAAATDRDHDAVIQLLLNSGAHVNAQGGKYGNALQAASTLGHTSIVRLLLGNGADPNIDGGYYGNALQVAATKRDNDAIIQLLLNSGAHINAQGGTYGNALQAASTLGHTSAVRLLLENGADVNAPGGPYKTALLAARATGHKDIVQLLVRRGRSGRNRSSRPKSD